MHSSCMDRETMNRPYHRMENRNALFPGLTGLLCKSSDNSNNSIKYSLTNCCGAACMSRPRAPQVDDLGVSSG